MTLNDDIRALAAAPLFEQLSSEQLRLLAFGAERMRFTAGRALYREHDRADCGYLIIAGSVELTREIAGQPQTVRRAGPGDVLGQIALITETSRLTGAIAATDTETLRINRSLFRRMLAEYPETAAALHAALSADLKELLTGIGALETRFKAMRDI